MDSLIGGFCGKPGYDEIFGFYYGSAGRLACGQPGAESWEKLSLIHSRWKNELNSRNSQRFHSIYENLEHVAGWVQGVLVEERGNHESLMTRAVKLFHVRSMKLPPAEVAIGPLSAAGVWIRVVSAPSFKQGVDVLKRTREPPTELA